MRNERKVHQFQRDEE
jgi:hypothetical protein